MDPHSIPFTGKQGPAKMTTSKTSFSPKAPGNTLSVKPTQMNPQGNCEGSTDF